MLSEGAVSLHSDLPTQATRESVLVLKGPQGRINRAVWGPLNKTIISAGEDAVILIWDAETGKILKESDKEIGHKKCITSLQKSVDGSHFITGSLDKSAKNYTTERPVNSVTMLPLLNHVVLGGGQDASAVTTTDHRAGKVEAKFYDKILTEEIGGVKGHFGPINALAFNPDGKSQSRHGSNGGPSAVMEEVSSLSFGGCHVMGGFDVQLEDAKKEDKTQGLVTKLYM
ncbi:hypothetical protein H5410_055513 [Solanum commersonii]|uniref:Serine-threonine kinase receptor-associated protein n=1 Tax=Solanum commersonii TaxID=4109 RepID=A0A9J5WHS4_SOLCO|nr:hypothetical protein H5410_055513 [Solanum commersonii]